MTAIEKFLASHATRQWLYVVITALVPLLVSYGIIDNETAALWLALAAAVLGTGTASAAVVLQRRAGTLDSATNTNPDA